LKKTNPSKLNFFKTSLEQSDLKKLQKTINQLRRQIKCLKIENQKLQSLSVTDDLTGLYNMRFFKERLDQEFRRAARYHTNLSLIMFDLDYFKNINDCSNHLMGSYVIAQVGKLVAATIRTMDIAARYGGDEYIILLPETTNQGAIQLANRVREDIELMTCDNGDFQTKLTASFGIGCFPSSKCSIDNKETLMKVADENLYHAKHAGRNCVFA